MKQEAAVRTEPCACGGVIGILKQDLIDGRKVSEAIKRHQRTPRHQAWNSEAWANALMSLGDVPVK